MRIDPALLTPAVHIAAAVLALLALAVALRAAPWRALHAVPVRQHLLFLCVLALVVLHLMAFRPVPGISLHLLGMTAITALLGTSLATLAGLLAITVLALAGQQSWSGVPLSWLLGVVVPALATGGLLALLARSRVRNLFVFLLGIGFGGGMVAVLATALAGMLVLLLAGQGVLASAGWSHIAMLPLFLFPEGFVNGAALSTLTVYFPHLVRGFDEERFLEPPPDRP